MKASIRPGAGQALSRYLDAIQAGTMHVVIAGSYAGLDRILVLPWNERYTSEHVRYIADSIAGSLAELRRAAA